MIYILIFVILLVLELFYFRIADKFKIIDKPNLRSSHTIITLRGGGIIFYLGMVLYAIIYYLPYPYFFIGLSLVSLISFVDDIKPLSPKVRFSVQILALFLMFYQWELFSYYAWWYIALALILCVGIINAYNFMDGINGMTGGYSLVLALTLLYINQEITQFVDSAFLYIVVLSLIVFNIFNFRTKAKCFAGDIGSIGIAFILVFILGMLILKTNNLYWIILLAVYGVDSIFTIAHRLILCENIFQPHRKHIYQMMANELHIPHVRVALLYLFIQLVINIGYFICWDWHLYYTIFCIFSLCCLYILSVYNIKTR